ncbi:unnamed protein product [Aphanomyces euteiches]|nr:hypothetical protein Ae201684P_018159 [Aphanomyces euteiches]
MTHLSVDEAEYFEMVIADDMQSTLDEHYGVILARVGAHPFWPARVCEMEEWIDYLPHRQRKGQICVYFYGSHNYGWVLRNNINEFVEDHPSIKSKKGTKMYLQYMEGIEEAKKAIAAARTAYMNQSFSERLKLKKIEVENDIPCAACKKKGLDERRIVCDGKHCELEYHMGCLQPPLVEVPAGEWFCPACDSTKTESSVSSQSSSTKRQNGSQNKRGLASNADTLVASNDEASSEALSNRKKQGNESKRREPKGGSVDLISEERCFLCGLGGELVVCEFPRCTKVYHQLCLGAYPFPMDEETEWICPRHTCVISGRKENPMSTQTSKTMWHCLNCPIGVETSILPTHSALSRHSKRDKTIICPHCNAPSPRVRLAKLLERIWSIVATNRQGMPFCGPLLVGVDRPPGLEKTLDLFQIIADVRRLSYSSAASFVSDINEVVRTALDILHGKDALPLVEAARSMSLTVEEQVQYHASQFETIEALLANDDDIADESWPVAWRKECMPFGDKSYVHIEARSIEEWLIYISNASLYSNISPPQQTMMQHVDIEDYLAAAPPPRELTPEHEGSPLTLSDGIDVLSALSDLHRSDSNGRVEEPSLYKEELGVVPSISEMDVMFQQQASVLRKALTAHATLEHAWNINKQHMLGMRQDQVITIGEGRLAAELRIANNNLKARLRNKDQLLQQLTTDHMELNCQVKELQLVLEEKERRVKQLEEQLGPDCPLPPPPLFPDEETSSPIEKRHRGGGDDSSPSTPMVKRRRGRPPKVKPPIE